MKRASGFYIAAPLIGLFTVTGATIVASQENEGFVLDVEQSLEYSDNPDFAFDPIDEGLRSRTRLRFSFGRNTSSQTFSVTGNTNYVAGTGDTGFENSRAGLNYSVFNKNTRLRFSADFSDTEIDDVDNILNPLDTSVAGDDALLPDPSEVTDALILTGDGARIVRNYRASYVTGLNGPVEFQLNLSQAENAFTGVTDPSLFDDQTRRIGVSSTLRLSPTSSLRLFISQSQFDAEDILETDRSTFTYGATWNGAIRPGLTASAGLRQTNITTDRTTGRTEDDGPGFNLGLNQALKNGTLGFDLDSANTLNGQRTTAQVSRVMTLRNEASVAYSVGITDSEEGGSSGIYSFSYAKALQTGNFSVRLSQDANTNTRDAEIITTNLTATYARPLTQHTRLSLSTTFNQEDDTSSLSEDRNQLQARATVSTVLTSLSSVSLGLTYSDTEVTNTTATDDQRRFGLRVSYRHTLTQDWGLVASAEHSRLETDAGALRRENAIRVGLSRQFSFRP